jgi:hypothetical protein
MAMTIATIGRLIKKSEIMAQSSLAALTLAQARQTVWDLRPDRI